MVDLIEACCPIIQISVQWKASDGWSIYDNLLFEWIVVVIWYQRSHRTRWHIGPNIHMTICIQMGQNFGHLSFMQIRGLQ